MTNSTSGQPDHPQHGPGPQHQPSAGYPPPPPGPTGPEQGMPGPEQGMPGQPPGQPVAQPPAAPPPPAQPPAAPPVVAVPVREPGPFRRGFGLGAGAGAGIGVTLLVLGTVLSLLSTLVLAGMSALTRPSGSAANLATVWGSPSATKTLRAIDISGTILTDVGGGSVLGGGTYGYEVARMIDEIEETDADGLILRVNTPGGTVTGAKAIADAVDRYRKRTNKKVYAHVQGMSASGGVYAMAGADEIQADYGSMIGSIGVIFGPFSRYRDVKAIDGGILAGGVTTTGGIEQYYLSQGRDKDVGNPYRDMTEEERAVFTRGLENEYAAFVDHVATNRRISAQAIRDDLGAHLFDNKVAQEKRLIDGTMGVDAAYRHFATGAGLDPEDTKVVASAAPTMLQALLGAERRVPGQALPVQQQAGVRPVTAAAVCGPALTILVYQGNPARVCG